ncbi:NAD(P)H-hydrate epimerase [Candidatus Saganbacteria bacterium CG08_land_8_20_14_0_20_45_16]|uniref:NAD(P)H-hydrate epimerase n=1 Tax=Candidatus Saganbacteria bacterium CG08_land_8_20_14_0_20_45_16 TaxID=2014293 RepID=A0A2H0XZP3_UNCSA|nr:MAG: NAD(P)H-hydrate epimerase [Candidatus Saganbacteria bacterium CG08_land_8_20_14_0_20_45_16]
MKTISVTKAREFDLKAQVELGVLSLILMENAGRSVAEEALKILGARGVVAVVCGVGNNGGDGFVAARHLLNAGKKVDVFVVGDPAKLKPDPKINFSVLQKIKSRNLRVEFSVPGYFTSYNLIIDAIFGIGLQAEVRGSVSNVIKLMNKSRRPILAVDVPSGLSADTGQVLGVAVKAKTTVTFVANKKGFAKAQKYCGRVVVRDIGVTFF